MCDLCKFGFLIYLYAFFIFSYISFFIFVAIFDILNFYQKELTILKIKTQKHLPNIKPASDVIQNGIPISETVKGLLQNIEELYLYMDKMEARIKQLEEENKSLKNQ